MLYYSDNRGIVIEFMIYLKNYWLKFYNWYVYIYIIKTRFMCAWLFVST